MLNLEFSTLKWLLSSPKYTEQHSTNVTHCISLLPPKPKQAVQRGMVKYRIWGPDNEQRDVIYEAMFATESQPLNQNNKPTYKYSTAM